MSLFLRDQAMREENRYMVVMNMLRENEPIDKICRTAECDESFMKKVRKELNI